MGSRFQAGFPFAFLNMALMKSFLFPGLFPLLTLFEV